MEDIMADQKKRSALKISVALNCLLAGSTVALGVTAALQQMQVDKCQVAERKAIAKLVWAEQKAYDAGYEDGFLDSDTMAERDTEVTRDRLKQINEEMRGFTYESNEVPTAGEVYEGFSTKIDELEKELQEMFEDCECEECVEERQGILG